MQVFTLLVFGCRENFGNLMSVLCYFEILDLRSLSGSPLSPGHGKGGVILLRYRSFALQTCRSILEAGLVSISTFFFIPTIFILLKNMSIGAETHFRLL